MQALTEPPKPLSSSAFWGLRSIHKLAELLKVSIEDLEELTSSWCNEYKQFEKDDRWIETPKPRLHKVQRRIHVLLGRNGPPEYLFSGFRGRSSYMSVQRHDGSQRMVRIDVRKFYPSSDGRLVFDFFRSKLGCSSDVATMLFKLCTIKGTKNNSRAHLPTGGVTSPVLAYYCYMDLFSELNQLAQDNALTISIMADDICLSGEKADGPLLRRAEEIIESHGLKSNWKKRRAWPAAHANKIVTGIQITPKGLRVPLKRKKRITEFQEQLAVSKTPKERTAAFRRLYGALSSAGQIEERFRNRAEKVLAAWRLDLPAWQFHLADSATRRAGKSKA